MFNILCFDDINQGDVFEKIFEVIMSFKNNLSSNRMYAGKVFKALECKRSFHAHWSIVVMTWGNICYIWECESCQRLFDLSRLGLFCKVFVRKSTYVRWRHKWVEVLALPFVYILKSIKVCFIYMFKALFFSFHVMSSFTNYQLNHIYVCCLYNV